MRRVADMGLGMFVAGGICASLAHLLPARTVEIVAIALWPVGWAIYLVAAVASMRK